MTLVDCDIDTPAITTIIGLHAAIDEANQQSLLGLPLGELEAFTLEDIRAAERMNALVATSVAHADHAGLAPRCGHRSLNAHLAAQTHGPTSAVAPARTIGLWLDDFPAVAQAWARGELTDAHVRELKKIDNVRTNNLLRRDQHLFVESATTLQFADWLASLAYWMLHADPDGSLPGQRKTRYGLKLQTDRYGDLTVNGTLDPLTGEALRTMVEHESEKLYRDEQNARKKYGALNGYERDAIALMRLVKRGFRPADGGFPVPLVNIVMSQQVAEALITRTFDGDDVDWHTLPVDWADPDRRCETIRGIPLDPRRTLPALLIGRLRRQILDADGRTLDLGHDVRLFPPVLKNALLVESRGRCTTPGCDAPWAWLEADHIVAHGNLGPTAMANGQIKCRPDNLRKGRQ